MNAIFKRGELPVADKMLDLIDKRLAEHPFQQFMCFWIAFNNIYTTNSYTLGKSAQLIKDDHGTIYRDDLFSSFQMPSVSLRTSEKDQIVKITKETTIEFQRSLISDEHIQFFVNRNPIWNGREIEHDIRGQELNGVININKTVDENTHFGVQ